MKVERDDSKITLTEEQLYEVFHADSSHEMFFNRNIVTIEEAFFREKGKEESWQNPSLIDDLKSTNSPQETLDK